MKKLTIEQINTLNKELKIEQRNLKLKRAVEWLDDSKRKAPKYCKQKGWEDSCLKNAKDLIDQSKNQKGFSVPWKPKKQVFEYTRLSFDPISMIATSYEWYNIAQVIKGKMYLNVYNYSMQTSRHHWALRDLFKELGIKFETLDAPMGLQDLGTALVYAMKQKAKNEVAQKYGRTSYKRFINQWNKEINKLKSLGAKTGLLYETCLNHYEYERNLKLEQKRNDVKIVMDKENKMTGKEGLHIFESGYVSKWQRHEWKKEAKSKGFKKVYVHPEIVDMKTGLRLV